MCNQKCRFCSNPEREATLDFEQARQLIDDFVSRGYDGIILTGGEPTLNKELPRMIRYASERGLHSRVITNGQRMADLDYLKTLVDAGLNHVHVSIQTYDERLQAFLSQNQGSLKNALQAVENLGKLGVTVNINTTINHYNANHLDKTVRFLLARFPFIDHFVWNNLDPKMNRASENPDVIPKLWEFEVSLYRAMSFLHSRGKTFRAERIPLCYMAEFAWASTETRKIIKGEERIVRFLDEKGFVRETLFEHGKADVCRYCRFDPICAGLYEMDTYYSSEELYPVFLDPEEVRRKVLGGNGT